MEKIHFDQIGGDKKWASLFVISLALIFTGFFELIDFSFPAMNKWLITAGFFIHVLFLSKLFWYKNVVQWNKKGVVIRIKSYVGKSLRFSEIESTHMNDKKLTIEMKSGKLFQFDLNEFPENDSKKLSTILAERVQNWYLTGYFQATDLLFFTTSVNLIWILIVTDHLFQPVGKRSLFLLF